MIVEFSNVSMTYKPGIQALKNVTFRIDDGEFVFIIGMSGSGKSTLIKLLTCEERPTAGKVFIDHFEITRLKRNLVPFLRRNIGMVFQDFRLIQSRNVYQNVAFAMEIVGATNDLIRHRVPMVLSTVGLRDKAGMLPGQLSGGEQQRVAIARAMVNNPALILADEPTGNLDPINSESIMALLKEINDTGTTVVICTHDATMVNKLKRRVIEISEGYLVRDDVLGEYNLSPELRRNRKQRTVPPAGGKRKEKTEAAHDQDESPFVRNINIKFGELGFGLSDEREEELPLQPAEGMAEPVPEADAETLAEPVPEADTAALPEPASETVAPEAPSIVDLPEEDSRADEDLAVQTSAAMVLEEPAAGDASSAEPQASPEHAADSRNDEQEAIRIAVEYYMKKARKLHEDKAINSGKKEFFAFDTEDAQAFGEAQPPDGVQDDFIKLIKPKRISAEQPPEDKP